MSVRKTPQNLKTSDIVQHTLWSFDQIKHNNSIKNLVEFHTKNKYLLMAFNQNELKILGNIVANREKNQIKKIFSDYEIHLKKTLNKPPTRSRHANVLRKLFSYYYSNLDQFEIKKIEKLITVYQKGAFSIGDVLGILESITMRFDISFLFTQTYFLLYSERKD